MHMTTTDGPIPIGEGFYWVGSRELADSLQCNPYLLVDGDEAVLFDPGSVLDVDEVVRNVESLVPLDKVRYIVLHHQDPDLASAVPRMEALGMRFTIVTHWRTWSLVRYYGIVSPVYLVDEHGFALTLASGRILHFLGTPYLHFPGAIATYDKTSRYLVSSDLFGAFSPTWSLYAGDTYMEGMKAFHEHYIPSNEVLRPVMELFACLDIQAILPQHGSIIAKDVQTYIHALENLECGSMRRQQSRERTSAAVDYQAASVSLLQRSAAVFGAEVAVQAAARFGIVYATDPPRIADSLISGKEQWDRIAEALYLEQGMQALLVLEPHVATLCATCGVKRPPIYDSALNETSKNLESLGEEVARLKRLNEQLTQSTDQAQDVLMKDAVTGLYNETFFRNFIDEQASIMLYGEGVEDDTLAVIGVDEGMARIEYRYGPKEVEAILEGVARIITEAKAPGQPSFRMHGATFALWLPRMSFSSARELCEKIRLAVEKSKSFIEPVTVSIGMVSVAEIRSAVGDPAEAGDTLTELGVRRLRIARKRGGNTICLSSEVDSESEARAQILVVDDDAVNADVIKTFLENSDYRVTLARDGDEALKKVGEEGFDLIISELMVPKIDGFMIKEALSRRSGTKDIPFILLSHLKDEQTVVRAYSLGINNYLKKPFLLAELLGIVRNLAGSGDRR